MKFIVKSIAIFILSSVCYAADESVSMQQGMGKMKGMGEGKMQGMSNMDCMDGKKMQGMGSGSMDCMSGQLMQGMGGMGKMSPEQMEEKMRSMQKHMLKMHDLSNQILSEKNPKKRQVLKDKQLELMKKHMEMIQSKHKMHKNMKMMQ